MMTSPKPYPAASLIIARTAPHGLQFLMGRRADSHKFMPGFYVFPGGRIEESDYKNYDYLKADDSRFTQSTGIEDPTFLRAAKLAAIRETFEETGLRVATSTTYSPEIYVEPWLHFHKEGYFPLLDALRYVGRAITPAFSPIRFDAHFFLVHNQYVDGDLKPSGELENLHWVSVEELEHLQLAGITRFFIREGTTLMKDPFYEGQNLAPLHYFDGGSDKVWRKTHTALDKQE